MGPLSLHEIHTENTSGHEFFPSSLHIDNQQLRTHNTQMSNIFWGYDMAASQTSSWLVAKKAIIKNWSEKGTSQCLTVDGYSKRCMCWTNDHFLNEWKEAFPKKGKIGQNTYLDLDKSNDNNNIIKITKFTLHFSTMLSQWFFCKIKLSCHKLKMTKNVCDLNAGVRGVTMCQPASGLMGTVGLLSSKANMSLKMFANDHQTTSRP